MLLCVTIPDYPLAVALLDAEPSDAPTLLADRRERGRAIAIDGRAYESGARVGQTIAQASAAAHGARVLVHDAARARALWDDLLDALDAVSPLVDGEEPGVAFLEMAGVPGTPDDYLSRARRALAAFGLPVRAAFASNKFVARAAALVADGTICREGGERARVASLPLRVLGVDARALERLQLLGIRTLRELAALPYGPFVRRFGGAGATWHERASGIDRTPFLPRAHAVAIEATLFGEGTAEVEAQVVFALRVLIDRVCADMECLGKRAGALGIELELENGEERVREIGLAQPTAQARAMLDVLRANLQGVTFESPVVGLRVRALRLEEAGEALPLFRSADDLDPQTIAVTLARLEAALGEPARQARGVRAYALEEQFAYEPFSMPSKDTPPTPFSAMVVPQLQLLEVREIAVRLAAGAPAFVGSPPRAVLECTGPWRIEENWFSVPLVRDEYDVLLDGGALYRIYRQGQKWYLRGSYD
ncbi:MAG: DNA polymerase Y family protein [Candidatus Eremiobacteraeota bacterium]|nr:DNA polymerase Y family protein [Candidatus Eremiobacteraeota bacterium]